MAYYLLVLCLLWCGVTDSFDVYTDELIPTMGKPVVQSGTYLGHNASLALDGDPETYSAACYMCNDSYMDDPLFEWWEVDLVDNYIITSITVNISGYSKYMSKLLILISWHNSSDLPDHTCEIDDSNPERHINARCVIPTPGRYVTIMRTGMFSPRSPYFSINEVKVYGYLYKRVYDDEMIISLNKSTRQSGTYNWAHVSSYAVDGHPATCGIACTTCSRLYTGDKTFAWWQVDLGSNFIVTSVAITSSMNENNSKYLQHFVIWISTDNGTDLTLSQGQVCYNYNNGSILPRGEETTLNCTEPVTGRYVTIKRNGGCFRPDALTLCEVKVFGYLYTNATIHRHPPTTESTRDNRTEPCSSGTRGDDDLSTVKLLGSLLGFSLLVIGILVISGGLKIRQLHLRIKQLSDAQNDTYPIVLSDELHKGEPSNEN